MKKYNFLTNEEKKISKSFLKNGYYIFDIDELKSLNKIMDFLSNKSLSKLKIKKNKFKFDDLHKYLNHKKINDFRLELFRDINKQPWLMKEYYQIFKKHLDIIVGNELAMQNQVNLSLQMPKDSSSVLPMHADSFNGESPFEIVAWLPLVNCSSTKSMFILPNKVNDQIISKLSSYSRPKKGGMYSINMKVKKKIKFLKINLKQGLIFSPNLFHGNKKNITKETRWSLNTRFKSLLSPYTSDEKSLGTFYVPITTREATIKGINFKKPNKFIS